MSGSSEGFEEYVMERLDDMIYELKRIAAALETIAQTVSPQVIEKAPAQGKKSGQKKAKGIKNGKELSAIIARECETLHENLKDIKKFKSGDWLIKIDYVDTDTFKEIAREAEEALGAKYSRKYRGFIVKGGE